MTRSCVWAGLSAVLLMACGEDTTCPQAVFPAVSVHALGATTAAPVLDARGEVRDGSFADSLVEVGQGYYDAAPGRAGTYAVHLEHGTYAAWDTSGIVVSAGGACPDLVETEQIEARLVPIE